MGAIAFIPARGGSKSIPLKNIKLFNGKPLIFWSLQAANNSSKIDEVVVSTDDKKIREVVLSFAFKKVKIFDRSPENASDIASTESAMLEYIEAKRLDENLVFVLLQLTSPLITSIDIDRVVDKIQKENFDSALTSVRTKRFYWNDNGPINYNPQNRPRRQDMTGLLMENGAAYASTVRRILHNNCRISGNIGVVEMPEYTGIEIDEPLDWNLAEMVMQKFGSLPDNSGQIKLIISDVDGVLTDGGMYYSEVGDELKKFNTRDGMGFELARNAGFKTAIITSEVTGIVDRRAKKLKLDFIIQGEKGIGKLEAAKKIAEELNISLNNIAYIGDDVNCKELLSNVGYAACPKDASNSILQIPKIKVLERKGGEGVFREFVEILLEPQP